VLDAPARSFLIVVSLFPKAWRNANGNLLPSNYRSASADIASSISTAFMPTPFSVTQCTHDALGCFIQALASSFIDAATYWRGSRIDSEKHPRSRKVGLLLGLAHHYIDYINNYK
jgi:hypothetical protein